MAVATARSASAFISRPLSIRWTQGIWPDAAQCARDDYRDDEAKYHLRPSIWIKPNKPWDAGAVELLELPTDNETSDNIAAYWIPKQPAKAGDTLALTYQVRFASADPEEHGGGRSLTTQVDRVEGGGREFHVVMDGAAFPRLCPPTRRWYRW